MDKNSFNPINYIATTNLILILKNFIAMQSIIFFPYIKHSVILAFLFSIFQSFLIIYYIFNGDKFTANVSKFISNKFSMTPRMTHAVKISASARL